MRTLKVISALLCYPQADMQTALGEMAAVVEQEALLPAAARAAVLDLIQEFAAAELLELQERYVAQFDRGRSLSLHLFEHAHGESRVRGQAMVDLMDVYRAHGFVISARELPDYLPLLLEYLSQRPPEEGRDLLTDAMPIISLLGARLQQADSPYHVLFEALESFAGAPAERAAIRANVAAEGPDQTLVRMDEIWEEEAVSFLGAPAACQADVRPAATPAQWLLRPAARPANPAAGANLPPASTEGR